MCRGRFDRHKGPEADGDGSCGSGGARGKAEEDVQHGDNLGRIGQRGSEEGRRQERRSGQEGR